MSLIRSRQRVANHGEVLTPAWLSGAMLSLVEREARRIDARCLDPASGDCNFLIQVLSKKLTTVQRTYSKKPAEKRHYGLLALMCVYGIELLPDNVAAGRRNMLDVFARWINLGASEVVIKAATRVIASNIIHGNALSMKTNSGLPIVFPEWRYLGAGQFQKTYSHSDSFCFRSDLTEQSLNISDIAKGEQSSSHTVHASLPPMSLTSPGSTALRARS